MERDDDDELILRALVPEPDLEKMRAAGPVKRDYPLMSSPELDQVHRLMRAAKSPVVQVRTAKTVARASPSGGLNPHRKRTRACAVPSSSTSCARRSGAAARAARCRRSIPSISTRACCGRWCERAGVDAALIEDVITGCVIQVAEQSGNIGRQAALAAGLPESVAGRHAGPQMRLGAAGVRFRRAGRHRRRL